VQVFLLADGYASQHIDGDYIASLQEAGVHFRRFEPIFKSSNFYFGRRLHHKVFVADHYKALVGGINIENKYNDMPDAHAWFDVALHTEGETAIRLSAICCEMWNGGKDKSIFAKQPDEVTTKQLLQGFDGDECAVRVRRNDWVKRKSQIWKSYFHMLNTCTDEMIIASSYFLPGLVFRKRMVAAIKRGATLKVIVAGPSDVRLAKSAEKYLYRWMLRNGIELYEYTRTILHAKVAVSDNKRMTIGSYNFNNISAYASIELNLDVRNKPFVSDVQEELNNIIKNDCKRITATEHNRKTPYLLSAWQYLAYLIVKLLLNVVTFYYTQEK
jgi:cardiolipin synthase A/B